MKRTQAFVFILLCPLGATQHAFAQDEPRRFPPSSSSTSASLPAPTAGHSRSIVARALAASQRAIEQAECLLSRAIEIRALARRLKAATPPADVKVERALGKALAGLRACRNAEPPRPPGGAPWAKPRPLSAERSSHVRATLLTVAPATVDRAGVHRSLQARRKAMRSCYDSARASKPKLQGDVGVTLRLRRAPAAAAVASLQFTYDNLGAPNMTRCLSYALAASSFPSTAAGARVTARLSFSTARPTPPHPPRPSPLS